MVFSFQHCFCVITSYSIHYPELYERELRGQALAESRVLLLAEVEHELGGEGEGALALVGTGQRNDPGLPGGDRARADQDLANEMGPFAVETRQIPCRNLSYNFV